MRLICAALTLAALSCAHSKASHPQEAATPGVPANLVSQRYNYEGQLRMLAIQSDGWVSKGCDALLFSSLFGAALADTSAFRVGLAEDVSTDGQGKWLRRPITDGICDPTISKDMLLGLTYYAWRAKRTDIMQGLVDYGVANQWVMGAVNNAADLSKVVVTPSMAGLFYQVLYRLGGPDHPSRLLPDEYPAGLTGFEAHLQVTDILLRGEVSDTPGITDAMLARLNEHAAANPRNPYYAAALALYTGDSTKAVALLGDTSQWPSDQIPGPGNHCQPWPIQRDDGDRGWQPCITPDPDTYYGADFVWVVDLLTRPRRAN